ncbi:MAG: hypothetical protein NTW04_01705 [Elusimicrobia bacterium]|nr:hypothetical protein [Elusimicrobiota bacterium]
MKKLKSSIFWIATFFLLGCNGQELANPQNENKQLKEKITKLETENNKLKETADFHYKSGVEYLAAKNWVKAKSEFDTIINKFPLSSLVANARNGYSQADKNIIEEEKIKKIAEVEERNRMQKEVELIGIDVTMADLLSDPYKYIGKRIRLSGRIMLQNDKLWNDYHGFQVISGSGMISVYADNASNSMHKRLWAMKFTSPITVVGIAVKSRDFYGGKVAIQLENF